MKTRCCTIVRRLSGIMAKKEKLSVKTIDETMDAKSAQQGESDPLPWKTATQPEGFHQQQIQRNVIQAALLCKNKRWEDPDHSSPPRRLLMHTCIIIRRAFFSPLMITAQRQLYCLFGWEHKRYALILYSSIVELGIVSMNAGEMGPNYGERCLPATPRRSAMMKVSNWEEKSNQRPLVVFCKFKNPNMEKHSPLRRTVVHFCRRLD